MIARAAASVVVATTLVLGTAGCAFVTPQATRIQYQPADGVAATVGDIELRNVIALSADGTTASLVFSIVNETGSLRTVDFQYENAEGVRVDQTLVAREGLSSVGGRDGESTVELTGLDVQVGALLPVFVHYADQPGVELQVPVLDGEQEQFATLVPVDASAE